jgi:hypothetical protein
MQSDLVFYLYTCVFFILLCLLFCRFSGKFGVRAKIPHNEVSGYSTSYITKVCEMASETI